MKYRVILTFRARSVEEAAAIAACPERMPRESTMRVINVDQRRQLRLALIAGVTIAFWLAVAIGAVGVWRSL